jgi:hypothetical protein
VGDSFTTCRAIACDFAHLTHAGDGQGLALMRRRDGRPHTHSSRRPRDSLRSRHHETRARRGSGPAFRVYQRRGYYRPGLRTDRDAYDTKAAAYFLTLLPTGHRHGVLLGSARVIFGESRTGFRFPAEQAFEFELPATIAAVAASDRVEVTRVAAEPVQGIVIGGLLTRSV